MAKTLRRGELPDQQRGSAPDHPKQDGASREKRANVQAQARHVIARRLIEVRGNGPKRADGGHDENRPGWQWQDAEQGGDAPQREQYEDHETAVGAIAEAVELGRERNSPRTGRSLREPPQHRQVGVERDPFQPPHAQRG